MGINLSKIKATWMRIAILAGVRIIELLVAFTALDLILQKFFPSKIAATRLDIIVAIGVILAFSKMDTVTEDTCDFQTNNVSLFLSKMDEFLSRGKWVRLQDLATEQVYKKGIFPFNSQKSLVYTELHFTINKNKIQFRGPKDVIGKIENFLKEENLSAIVMTE